MIHQESGPTGVRNGILLPHRRDGAPLAMALDEAQLEMAQEGLASLRVYSWEGPNLTLGYFQKAEIRNFMGQGQLPWARRATGGEALLHHHELTYAFALPSGHPLARFDPQALSHLIHQGICNYLKHLEIPAFLHEGTDLYLDQSGLCFQHWSRGDLILKNSKIMGSAQRRRKGTLLQHGGLLLKKSVVENRLLGIQDLSPSLKPENDLPLQLENLISDKLGGVWQKASASISGHWLDKGIQLQKAHESSAWREKR